MSGQHWSGYQLSAFEIGQIKAHLYHGLGATAIAGILVKPGTGGKGRWSPTAIQKAIDKLETDRLWRGQRAAGSGAPRLTTPEQDKQLVKAVFARRGIQKVTVSSLMKRFRWARSLSHTALEERLHDAKLAWLPSTIPTLCLGYSAF